MTKILILFSLFYSFSSNAEIVRNKVSISTKQLQDAKVEVSREITKDSTFDDSTMERLRVFNDQGLKDRNNSGSGQFIDIRIPLIWYVHVF
jgi:hypothetical protein